MPAWLALMEHVPTPTKLRVLPETLHTAEVIEVNVTVKPELAVAVKVSVLPKFCAPGLAKVMVWLVMPFEGVTELLAAEAALVPAVLVAVTVKV